MSVNLEEEIMVTVSDILLIRLVRPHQITKESYRDGQHRVYNFRRGPLNLYGCYVGAEDAQEFLRERLKPGPGFIGVLIPAFRLASPEEEKSWKGY